MYICSAGIVTHFFSAASSFLALNSPINFDTLGVIGVGPPGA